MSKIIGVTVGTPTSPDKIAEKLQIAEMRTQIEKIQSDLNYVPIAINSLSLSTSTAEKGSTVDNLIVTWALNKTPKSQTMNGDTVAVDMRSLDFRGLLIDKNTTFALVVKDERDATASKSVSLSFYNGVYYGAMADGAAITSAAILGLTRKLQGSKGITFTANAGAGYRIAYAIPTAYGTPVFNVGGFDGGFSKAATISHTNASGHTENYDVWLSDNMNLGSTTVKVS